MKKPVEIEHPDQHPLVCSVQYNNLMRRWDLQLILGNFKSRKDAEEASESLMAAVAKWMPITVQRVS